MILDFHNHAVRPDPNMPAGYKAFMSANQGGDPDKFDEFTERYSNPQNFLAVLDDAGIDYAVVLAETAVITSAVIPNDHVQQFAFFFLACRIFFKCHGNHTRELSRCMQYIPDPFLDSLGNNNFAFSSQ